jgi:XFP N-terminal domain
MSSHELAQVDAGCRAANYLSVGQVYLMGNPLLRAHLARTVAARARDDMPAIRDWIWPHQRLTP